MCTFSDVDTKYWKRYIYNLAIDARVNFLAELFLEIIDSKL